MPRVLKCTSSMLKLPPMPRSKLTIQEIHDIIRDKVVGKITPCHDQTGHHYQFMDTGTIEDSITQKISVPKPHLLKWYGRQAVEWLEPMIPLLTPATREDLFTQASLAGERTRDQAGDVGSAGHILIEKWINDGGADITNAAPAAIAVFHSAQKFFQDHSYYTPIATELVVGDESHGAVGTMDVLLYDTRNGSIIVGDWKSSNGIDEFGYSIQVASYHHCLKSMTGLRLAPCALIVKLSKESARYEVYKVPGLKTAFKAFTWHAKLYEWMRNGIPKVVFDKKIITL